MPPMILGGRRLLGLGVGLVLATASCIGGDARRSAQDGGVEAGVDAAALGPRIAPPPGRGAAGDAGKVQPSATRGAELYGRYCDFCHGAKGEGYAADEAPRLASEAFLGAASDAFLKEAILKGRPGTTMSAWAIGGGGPLRDDDADALIAFLRTLAPNADGGAALQDAPKGDAARGKPVFAARCATCHGSDTKMARYGHLANASLLGSASDAFLATAIRDGRPGTPMPAWRGTLSEETIGDLVALLRSWHKPDTEPPAPLPPRPGKLVDVVIHPKGKAPPFGPKADFVPVDEVKKALDGKMRMVILDARASGDFARMHVAGAISVPFYEVEAYAPQIPKDVYILTYCACPHAASVKARDALRKLGYPKVAVLDEGILAWRDRGYPVRGGAKP